MCPSSRLKIETAVKIETAIFSEKLAPTNQATRRLSCHNKHSKFSFKVKVERMQITSQIDYTCNFFNTRQTNSIPNLQP